MFPGEYERGLTKQPIAVIPADASVYMAPASRLHYAKAYPVEMNVKVKNIGDVDSACLDLLLQYYREENLPEGFAYPGLITSYPAKSESISAAGDLFVFKLFDSEFETVNNPKAFFKKGRVFMTPWPEPSGDAIKDQTGPRVSVKIRTFVVIRPQNGHCTCIPINTYQDQGTRKPGVIAKDHAAVVPVGERSTEHPLESLTKSPIFLKVENLSTGPVDPMSRINFAKVYTIEENVKVRNIGRIVPESIHQMDEYFKESFKFGTESTTPGQTQVHQAPAHSYQPYQTQPYQSQTYQTQTYQPQTYQPQSYQY
ncbi:uncharacterized protein N0V89_006470 [Didymosphaeria variabile]|uniref:DUF6590 domain-containing protein n=1 Tax=Didymosphaeria variabile TaxID=1932322 RepID=A0A9W9C9Z0_9PLEO|nr:uncharacterized protein N0V89_006470 [Didymosphaeria variabile]KAJ4351131.1 hypothetical protein N0V89_006470 [Didymosphaeria variabile]